MAAVDRGTTSTRCILFDQLLSTVGYELGSEPAHCALEGSIAITGSRAVVSRWPRADPQSTGAETLAPSVDDNGGCYIVPAFAGLFAPHWRSEARGVIVGLTSYVNKGHLARAVLEAVAWQTREVVDAMDADPGLALSMLRVDGGMVADQLLMQTLADVLDAPVARPMVRETVSRGAAYAARLAVGYWPDLEGLRRDWHRTEQWVPAMDPERASRSTRTGRGRWPARSTGSGWVPPTTADPAPEPAG